MTVGTGVGGSTVASGIESEDVLILEAGTEPSWLMNIPMLTPILQNGPYDWNFYTESQEKSAKGLKGRQIHFPLGKVVGGSHVLNMQIYMRGHPEDHRVYVNGEYNFHRDIERYFEQFERDLGPEEVKFRTKLADAFQEAGQESGYGPFESVRVTQKHGMRFTVADFYKELNRNGHRVVSGAFVTRVTFEEDLATASGVEFTKSGKEYSVRATKGVILSAGTVGSAKILLQSGIGPMNHLKNVGIPVRVNLPVGENLIDHVSTGYNILLLNESLSLDWSDILTPKSLCSFAKGEGPWTMPGCESSAILSLSSDIPNLQFMVLPVGLTQDFGVHLKNIANIDDKVWEKYFGKMLGMSAATILPVVLHPKSQGVIRLKDSNPYSSPVIDPQYLSHPEDREVLLKGIRILQKLIDTEAMQKIGAEINPLPFPGCENFPWDSRDYWLCYIEHLTLTTFHPAGTCSMGSVVDRNFRVLHMEKLFVVDASVMPKLPSGNPMGTIGMLAHRFLAVNGISKHFPTEISS
uniref:Glucose-methanol-choline oxidoreductase N-terminal domain-containing protein n=1 Tax=Phlebotomus papatasi TaxID=29031 RepID=A0A1B0D329_PHLPP